MKFYSPRLTAETTTALWFSNPGPIYGKINFETFFPQIDKPPLPGEPLIEILVVKRKLSLA